MLIKMSIETPQITFMHDRISDPPALKKNKRPKVTPASIHSGKPEVQIQPAALKFHIHDMMIRRPSAS